MSSIKNFNDLSTSYVNLAALIRHLREQQFAGTIHVIVDQYEAEVRLAAVGEPAVAEIDRANGRALESEGAMERLLVHAREPGGTITVHATEDAEESSGEESKTGDASAERGGRRKNEPGPTPAFTSEFPTPAAPPVEEKAEVDWEDLLDAGGTLIRGLERAVVHVGADFELIFRAACIKLGDDYPFLDPTTGGLSYADKRITLNKRPAARTFVAALVECLRRITNQLAIGKESKRFRETVAIELAVAARMRSSGLSQFTPHLDQIAGTRVL